MVGEVAGLELSDPAAAPLEGVTVGLSGSGPMLQKLRAALEPLGARTFTAQQSVLQPLPVELDCLWDGSPRWLVFTSANGVREFFRRLRAERTDLRRLWPCRLAVIGAATGGALSEQGFQADLCPSESTTAALGRALLSAVPPEEEIVLLRSRQGSEELFRILSAARTVRDLHLYDALPSPQAAEEARAWLPRADWLVFTSAGGVRMFLAEQGGIPPRARCVCIGEVTAAALSQHWDGEPVLAEETSVEGIVTAILSWK